MAIHHLFQVELGTNYSSYKYISTCYRAYRAYLTCQVLWFYLRGHAPLPSRVKLSRNAPRVSLFVDGDHHHLLDVTSPHTPQHGQ